MIRSGLHQGSVEVLTLAGNETVVDGQSSRKCGQNTGADVDEVVRPQNRRNRAGALHDAGHRLALPFPAAARGPGPAIAIAAHGRVDDIRLARLHLLIANAEPIGSTKRGQEPECGPENALIAVPARFDCSPLPLSWTASPWRTAWPWQSLLRVVTAKPSVCGKTVEQPCASSTLQGCLTAPG